ncbi:sphingomyelin phosphodiesterase [uncultured Shewanella sp.]|uniref:sphingomyelin phosphodiesterase n=1 Tax=uncultured Shewanella sp. TaxID=173975 RepID=UPI002607968F|nr:sphingomyelin phosphodiesterase [uncultured Shewanella sp.]
MKLTEKFIKSNVIRALLLVFSLLATHNTVLADTIHFKLANIEESRHSPNTKIYFEWMSNANQEYWDPQCIEYDGVLLSDFVDNGYLHQCDLEGKDAENSFLRIWSDGPISLEQIEISETASDRVWLIKHFSDGALDGYKQLRHKCFDIPQGAESYEQIHLDSSLTNGIHLFPNARLSTEGAVAALCEGGQTPAGFNPVGHLINGRDNFEGNGHKHIVSSNNPNVLSIVTFNMGIDTNTIARIYFDFLGIGTSDEEAEHHIDTAVMKLGGQKPDVIVFQEIQKKESYLKSALRALNVGFEKDHILTVRPTESLVRLQLSSGVLIASKHPITQKGYKEFSDCEGVDCYARKAVRYAVIEKSAGATSKKYHIFGTHLQGGRRDYEARQRQIEQMAQYIANRNIPSDEPVLILGDLNLEPFIGNNYKGSGVHEYQELLTKLKAKSPSQASFSNRYTNDCGQNTNVVGEDGSCFSGDGSPKDKNLDHILFMKDHLQPLNGYRATLVIRDDNDNDLSGHYPVFACLAFDDSDECSNVEATPLPFATQCPDIEMCAVSQSE